MAGYRVHLLDGWGNIVGSLEMSCPNDDAARSIMERFAGIFPLELWQGERLVDRYEADLGVETPEAALA